MSMTHSTSHQLICPLCTDASHLHFDLTSFLKHIKLFHSHQAEFKITCGIGGCQKSFTHFRTFQNHISSIHRYQNDPNNQPSGNISTSDASESNVCNYDPEDDNGCIVSVNDDLQSSSQLQKSSALLLMGLKEKHKLTQVSIQAMIEGITNLTQQRLKFLQAQACI